MPAREKCEMRNVSSDTMVHGISNANSEKTLEELRRVVVTLPHMPKNIVDDTRHEKVLSYVSAFIAQADQHLMQTMLKDWAILDVLQACLQPDQDYRVSCVALRLLGFLMKFDHTERESEESVWGTLEKKYSSVLQYMIVNTMGKEALTRYSCWFALERAVQYDRGAQWLLASKKCAGMVSSALKDGSTYVLAAACQFLVAIIENRSADAEKITAHDTLMDTLLESIDLYKLIESMMKDQSSESNRVAGLEFLWMVTNTRSDRGATFLRQSRLFHSYMDLLMDDSRLVRSRALDVLSIVLDSVSDPLAVLGSKPDSLDSMDMDLSKDEALVKCFTYMLDHDVYSLLAQTESLKALHVATGIIDAMIMPLCHSDEMSGKGTHFKDTILAVVLWILQALQDFSKEDSATESRPKAETVVVPGPGKLSFLLNAADFQNSVRIHSRIKPLRGAGTRGGTLPKTIVLSALKALQSLALLFSEPVKNSAAIAITLSILFDQKLCSDQRVFKSCLATLPVVLKTKVQDGQLLDEHIFYSAMKVILGLIQRPGTSSTSLRLILIAIQEFFADSILGNILVNEKVGNDLSNGLGLKLYDTEWDVRDNVVEYIGNLFASGGPEHGVEWALKHDLLESIFQKLSDEEAYVRAASVHSFELVMRDARGWKGMCEKNLDKRLSAQLPTLIRDSEAFVRRSVLEAMICLVSERESGTVLMVNGTDLFVDATFMSRLTLDDADWEVRIRACEFLAAVWEHSVALDERADYRIRASKRVKDSDPEIHDDAIPARPSTWWFYDIKGDQILVEATRDSSRMVRLTSVETLKKIKTSIEQRLEFATSSAPRTDRLDVIADVDEGSLQQRKRLAGGDEHGSPSSEGQNARIGGQSGTHPHAAFYGVLQGLDFERLDATTSVEQLYEEVLNVERVEDVVMAENENPNDGNNVLDCY